MAGFVDLTGDRYGRLTIIKRAKYNLQGKPAWVCECDCGNIKVINGSSLKQGLTRSCGCLHKETQAQKTLDEVGNRYGKLVVLERLGSNQYGKALWKCQCDCGNVTTVVGSDLRNGHTKSCGCLCNPLGENHWSWRGGTSRNGYDAGFTEEFKEVIRKRDLYCCQICGMPQEENGQNLSVHHIDYDRKNTIPENCVSLCRSCHGRTNGNRTYWYNKLRRDK